MDLTTIIYIVAALAVGIIVTCIFKKGGNSSDKTRVKKLISENEGLKKLLSTAESKLKSVDTNSSGIIEIKAKYETLLKDANIQVEKLDQQLKAALDGKLDDAVKNQIAESEVLRKKIKSLETDLEEAEDDLSDTKRKLKNKDSDIADLQETLSKEQKVNNVLHEELLSVKQSLEEKMAELKLKMGSLDFVQEILSAPESNRNDVKQLDRNIAEMKSFALGQLIDCCVTLKDRYKIFNDGDFESFKKYWQRRFNEWASVTKKSWINGKTSIAFVGEFSAGKTSIVNRILSQDDPNVPQLPVSTKATTAIATYIAGGPVVSYQFVTPDDKLKTISQQTFTEKVSKEVLDQVKGLSSLIQYFVMTYKNPHLDGLSILDTPGFNSNDKNDAERTMEVINECDALFWVFDVNAGTVNRSSITIIKENLNKPLYVVINKVDTKAASEVQKVEDLIRKTLSDEGLTVEKFIKFSSKAPLSDIMVPIQNVQHIAAKEQYLSDLGDYINNCLGIIDSQVKETNRKYQQAEANGQKIDEKFIQQMRTLYGHCATASRIPHFEEHLFRKDNYEMSQEEYRRLCNVLDQSCSDVDRMASIYDEKTNSAGIVQQAWLDVCDAKAAWRSLNDTKVQFTKLQNLFK